MNNTAGTTTVVPEGMTTGVWTLDPSHSEVGFSVRHAGISKVRGHFSEVESTLHIGESLEASSLEATIQAASFDSRDANRDAHVKGPDFFDVEQFPTLTFTATGVKADDEDYILTGDLTIRGITKSVDFEVEYAGTVVDPFGATRSGFSGKTVISRKDFGLTWNAALEAGGVLVGDKVTITLDVAFVKNA
ncbi:MAG: YceI family protein [Arthrobacter sp.]|uniref:YceI family protein n=1 Tax=Arthrobacter sp. TaxID=1667 RepID=UPI003488853B